MKIIRWCRSQRDGEAFAGWCCGRLPSEAEWEHAASGGLVDPSFPYGDSEPDDTTIFANIWQGQFPYINTHEVIDAFEGLKGRSRRGRPTDIRAAYSKYAVGTHVIYCQEQVKDLVVISVLHGRMDVMRRLS